MKILQIIIITLFITSFLALTGCDTDGQIELKEPRKELSEMPPSKVWNVSDVFDETEESAK